MNKALERYLEVHNQIYCLMTNKNFFFMETNLFNISVAHMYDRDDIAEAFIKEGITLRFKIWLKNELTSIEGENRNMPGLCRAYKTALLNNKRHVNQSFVGMDVVRFKEGIQVYCNGGARTYSLYKDNSGISDSVETHHGPITTNFSYKELLSFFTGIATEYKMKIIYDEEKMELNFVRKLED